MRRAISAEGIRLFFDETGAPGGIVRHGLASTGVYAVVPPPKMHRPRRASSRESGFVLGREAVIRSPAIGWPRRARNGPNAA